MCFGSTPLFVNNHNKNIIEKPAPNNQPTEHICNCRVKKDCPVGGKCNSEKVVYQATIFPLENKKEEKVYFGISAGNWKQRYYNHKHSFTNPTRRNQTALSKWFWNLRDRGLTPYIKWKLIRRSSTPVNFKSRCNLCLIEKICIIKYKHTSKLLNQRNELIFKCRHKNKFKLG